MLHVVVRSNYIEFSNVQIEHLNNGKLLYIFFSSFFNQLAEDES